MAGKRKPRGNTANRSIYGSVDELATELGISRQSAYAALRQGKIPSIRLGKRFIIPRSAIAEWLKRPGEAPVPTS
jgi:excisionase family DNA binding protein